MKKKHNFFTKKNRPREAKHKSLRSDSKLQENEFEDHGRFKKWLQKCIANKRRFGAIRHWLHGVSLKNKHKIMRHFLNLFFEVFLIERK
jgi:hypothetical protein